MSNENIERIPLAARLAAISNQIGYIEKGGTNTAQNYKFVQESDVVARLKPLLAEAGIMVTPIHSLHSVVPFTTAKGSQQFLTTIESTFIFTDGVESIAVKTIGQGTDAGDKGIYKAMTGAKKYALLQAFLLATGDDPEIARDDERPKPSVAQVAKQTITNQVAVPKTQPKDDKLSQTQRKHIFRLRDELKLDNAALGEIRLRVTGKHNSAQMTEEDGDKLIAALEESKAKLAEIVAATGGTVIA